MMPKDTDSYLCGCCLSGDAMGVFRVWQFLDSWGIINYQAGAGAAEDADGVPVNVQPAGNTTAILHPRAVLPLCRMVSTRSAN